MKIITLNNGVKMSILGLGVFQISDLQIAEQTVSSAIDLGYRLIDTAAAYGNERAVGRAIKNSGISRAEFFITTKLWVSDAGYDGTKRAIKTSLKKLQVNYLDLYLIHQPYGDVYGSWRAMEEALQAGTIRAIGVSNFTSDRVLDLALYNDICPAVDQIETNPWMQQRETIAFLSKRKIQPEAWAPFAEGKKQIFNNPILKDIGQSHQKTTGQIILRWLIQRGIVVIPKTIHPERMIENINVFDFELTKKESQFFNHRDPAQVQRIHDWNEQSE